MKSEHKKVTYEDKFARDFYCQHARLNYIRFAKKANSKAFRRQSKEQCKKEGLE